MKPQTSHRRGAAARTRQRAPLGQAMDDQLYQVLAAHSSDVVILIDTQGIISFASPSLQPILGYDAEERIGQSAFEFIHPDDLDAVKSRMSRLLQTPGAVLSMDLRLRRQDGNWHWAEVTGHNLLADPRVKAIVVNYHDIDRYKRAEEALAAQFNFSLQVLNALGQGLTVTGSDRRFVFVNPAYARMVGYEPQELVGKTPYDFTIVDQHEILVNERARRERGEVSSYESRLRHRDGREIPVQITSVPRFQDGVFDGTIAVVADISERKQAEEDLLSLSLTDELTGLYNRRGFLLMVSKHMKMAERPEKSLLLYYVDFDGLKRINDDFGHAQGDRALTEVAELLKKTFRPEDIVARMGGDEFAIASLVNSDLKAEVLSGRLNENLARRNGKGDLAFRLDISVGVARLDDRNPCLIEELIDQADRAMYEQKQQKRS